MGNRHVQAKSKRKPVLRVTHTYTHTHTHTHTQPTRTHANTTHLLVLERGRDNELRDLDRLDARTLRRRRHNEAAHLAVARRRLQVERALEVDLLCDATQRKHVHQKVFMLACGTCNLRDVQQQMCGFASIIKVEGEAQGERENK